MSGLTLSQNFLLLRITLTADYLTVYNGLGIRSTACGDASVSRETSATGRFASLVT